MAVVVSFLRARLPGGCRASACSLIPIAVATPLLIAVGLTLAALPALGTRDCDGRRALRGQLSLVALFVGGL